VPRATRRRSIAASRQQVWDLVSDPYNLPRWWPRAGRVEGVEGDGGPGTQWTKVLETSEGRGVRADYRCVDLARGERYGWEQQLEGTPFERHLRRSAVEIRLQGEDGAVEVAVTSDQALRGLSRLGSPMMGRGQRALIDEALDGIERALE
jgi:uncharacterized protein YndB with AHSA1/START domain